MIQAPSFDVKTATVRADADLVLVGIDSAKRMVKPKGPYGALVEKLKKADAFKGAAGQQQFLAYSGKGSAHTHFVGMGAASEQTAEKLRVAGAHAFAKLHAAKADSVAVHVDALFDLHETTAAADLLHAFLEGLALSAYKFDKYKKKEASAGKKGNGDRVGPAKYSLCTRDKKLSAMLGAIAKDVRTIAECVNVTRDWSNEPANFGTPEYYGEQAKKLAKEFGISCKVLGEAEAKKEQMGLFLAVGAGAEREGKIVVLDYHPKGAKKTVALVGKGVTFDSGGISIKPSMRMEDMKHDMTGAATLFGAILLAARRKVQNRVLCVLAFTENMPDGMATQPSNVIYARNGKSVEIINTDAEGRLILADVLDYAQDFKPDVLVNAATLTGAVVVALGKQCCGIMGTSQPLMDELIACGAQTHERMWQLPLYDEYFEDLKTDCADMKNSANDGTGGTIRGGIFLKQFIRKGQAWAHLDIAATAYGMGHVPYYPKKGASGMHVRAIANFLGRYGQ